MTSSSSTRIDGAHLRRVDPTLAPPRGLAPAGRLLLIIALAAGIALTLPDPFAVLFFGSNAATGALLAIRRPRNPIGWLLLAIAFGFVGTTKDLSYPVAPLRDGSAPMIEFLWVWISAWSGYATFTLLIVLTFLFPSGHLPSGVWRRPAQTAVAVGLACTALAAVGPQVGYNANSSAVMVLVPNRFAVLPDLALWAAVPSDDLILPIAALLAAAAIGMIVRYRRAAGILRLQLRWLVASIALVVIGVIAGLASSAIFGDIGGLAWLGTIVAIPAVPVSIYVAVTRHRLYDIDRFISRTIGWLALTAVLSAVFAAAVVGLQAVLVPVTGADGLAVAGSTLVVASLFQPVRRRIQDAVDRRFDRARVDASRVASVFAAHLRAESDLDDVRGILTTAVRDTLGPAQYAMWVRKRSA